MGWKNVKEHYRIGHIVRVEEGRICIGSPYIYNIIVIEPDGTISKGGEERSNADLKRYISEMKSDPEKLRQLLDRPDTFGRSIVVYTYDGGEIIEAQCEELGWPNPTHDGKIQFENTYSEDKGQVVEWAKENARFGIENRKESVEEALSGLARRRAWLSEYEGYLEKLNADYPDEGKVGE